MYRGRTVAVVVPAYNERGLVTDVLASIPEFVDRVYVVDDCSTDGTYEAVLTYAKAMATTATWSTDGGSRVVPGGERGMADVGLPRDRIVPIRHERNRGAGGAIKTGYQNALADGMDVVVTIDADGQMDPTAMHLLLDPIVDGVADYAKGNRLADPARRGAMPTYRWVGNWLLTGLTKVASGYWGLRDPQNGYTAISHDALSAIDVGAIYEYYGYCNDVLVKLNAAEQRVADVPMPAAYGEEQSTIRLREYVPRVSGMLLHNFLWRLRARYLSGAVHPPVVAYVLAFACVAVGLGSLFAGLAVGLDGPVLTGSTVALTILLAGVLFTTMGMALDSRENRGLEVHLR